MPTVIVTNPLRALQVENQRLHRQNLILRRELEALYQQLAVGVENRDRSGDTSAAPVSAAPAIVPAETTMLARIPAQASAPIPLARRAQPEAPARTATRQLASGPVPRQVIHLVATAAPVPSAPRTSHAEPEALDDAALRFRLLELD